MNLGLLHPPMGSKQVDLSAYKAIGFDRGASVLKEGLWLLVSLFLFRLCPLKLFALKRLMLECFGARVGKGVVSSRVRALRFRGSLPWEITYGLVRILGF